MLQMPTGTGKTRLFSSIIKDLQDYFYLQKEKEKNVNKRLAIIIPKVLVLVHRKELIDQIISTLSHTYNHICGRIQSQTISEINRNVQVASVQTLSRKKRLNDWRDTQFDFIIIDEAHHTLADSYLRIVESFPDARLLGVTATPYRLNKQPFTYQYDKLIVSDPIYKFIQKGYLADYEYYSIKPDSVLQKDILNLAIDKGDYSEHAMDDLLNRNPIRANIIQTYEKYAKGKKGIVYTINKGHNIQLATLFAKKGYKTAYIDSDTPKEERDRVIHNLRQNNIDIVCNVDILSEGFDCPDVEFIQLARPTQSLGLYLQQVGRGLRTSFGKDKCIFLDNVGLYNKFGLPSAFRKWQYHFNGCEDWDIDVSDDDGQTNGYSPHNVVFIDIDEDNEPTQLIYKSQSQEKDPMCLSEIVKYFEYDISEVLTFFKENGYNLTPNTVLNEQQYDFLKNYYELDKKQLIGQIIYSILQYKKFLVNRKRSILLMKQQQSNGTPFKAPIDFAEQLLYEESAYKKFLTEENDVEIRNIIHYIKSKYNESLKDTMEEKAMNPEVLWVNITNLHNYLNCNILKIRLQGNYYYPATSNKTEAVRWVISRIVEMFGWKGFVILPDKPAKKIGINAIHVAANTNIVLPPTYESKVELMQKMASRHKIENDLAFFIKKNIEESNNIIKYNNMEYNIDTMSEKDLIQLLLLIDEKKELNLVKQEEAKDRIAMLEKNEKKKIMREQIDSLGITKEELLNFLLEEQKEDLQAIAQKNIDTEEQIKQRKLQALRNKVW